MIAWLVVFSKKGEESSDERAPEESSREHPEWFGLVAIDPQDEHDVQRNGNRRG